LLLSVRTAQEKVLRESRVDDRLAMRMTRAY
jgi:hypothetical protein